MFSKLKYLKLFFILNAIYTPILSNAANANFEKWILKEYNISQTKMLANFSRPDTVKGTIVAAPSYENPNYYYHWIRDGSVAIGSVILLLENEPDESIRKNLQQHIQNFIEVSKIHQNQNTPAGLGEVKFMPSGEAFLGTWMRPQNDGPAIRALVLSYYALNLIDKGQIDFVKNNLYNEAWPANTLIKKDLEYISNEWKEPCFDIWEEVYGDHFFTRLIQAQALNIGSQLAEKLNDPGAAHWYKTQSLLIKDSLKEFWNAKAMQIDATKNYLNNHDKESNLDTAALLAITSVGCSCNQDFGISDPRTIATAQKLKDVFEKLYPINLTYPKLGTAIGRYPEDTYNGYESGRVGNPWFLTTAALASYSYRLAWSLKKEESFIITEITQPYFKYILRNNPELQKAFEIGTTIKTNSPLFQELFKALFKEGDRYLKRVRFHMDSDGSMSEQFNRTTGYMQGAENLTMSYTAFIRSVLSRNNLIPF